MDLFHCPGILGITAPHIEDAAVWNGIPIGLYLYNELGLDNSLANFQKRDSFTNAEPFEKVIVRLNVTGWIEPMLDGSFQVTTKAREAVRHIVQAGDGKISVRSEVGRGTTFTIHLPLAA